MSLVWKLLRAHISIGQFAGFLLANMLGMVIVLLGFQFYNDITPVFTQEDSFMKANYVVVSKRIGTGATISGQSNAFTETEVVQLRNQSFVGKLCPFVSTAYKVNAFMGVNGQKVLSSEMFFESVSDDFVDINKNEWQWKEGSKEVPIILPRIYINMYNFGLAQNHNLPKLSEGLMGMIDFHINIRGNGHEGEYEGRVVGFSSSLSNILVPQSFMDWTNSYYAPEEKIIPLRLLMQVENPADKTLASYMEDKGYDIDTEKLDQEKSMYFLRFITTLVLVIGCVISILSFYILMLSIYLLVQKNTSKLENLLLIGYTPGRVAFPYQMLTVVLNFIVLVISLFLVAVIRSLYMDVIEVLYPDIVSSSILPAIYAGVAILVFVSLVNVIAIRRKMIRIWYRKDI